MTRDEVLRLACEAGFEWQGGFVRVAECVTQPELERFAALVAAQEREACAKVCEEEICSCCWSEDAQVAAEHLAAAIRERGKK